MRVEKSKATVYSFKGGRRYLSRAAALRGGARLFIREWFDGGCDDADMYAFAIRRLTELYRQAENEDHDDGWVAKEWEAAYVIEAKRLSDGRAAMLDSADVPY